MATAQTLINSALRKIGILAAGETATAEDSVDCLETLNRLFESLRLEPLMAYATTTISESWAATVASKSIGVTGVINTTRPVRIEEATFTVNTVVYPLELLDADEFLNLDPATQSGTPECLYYDSTYPLATIRLWPQPYVAGTLHANARTPLSAVALSDTITLPPGYERYLTYTLAIEMAPEYGRDPSQAVVALAQDAKADIKRNNLTVPTLSMPDTLPGVQRVKSWIGNG